MGDVFSGAEVSHVEGIRFIGLSDRNTVEETVENLSLSVRSNPLWFSNVTL